MTMMTTGTTTGAPAYGRNVARTAVGGNVVASIVAASVTAASNVAASVVGTTTAIGATTGVSRSWSGSTEEA